MTTRGSDPSGSVSVAVDAGGRVEDVRVSFGEESLRREQAFVEAFDRAWAAARAAALPPAPPAPEGQPLRARRLTRPERVPLRTLVEPHVGRAYRPPVGTAGTVIEGGEQGTSDNDCVHVVLDAGPGGRLTLDQGWLSNATGTQVGHAVRQAFAAAYRTREER